MIPGILTLQIVLNTLNIGGGRPLEHVEWIDIMFM